MRKFHLTPAQAEELRLAHRAERNRNAAYKINAVILLGTGWKLKAVKEALLLEMLDQKYFYAKEIIVILDNASYHYSQEVRDVIESSQRLKLVYLPPYSPELNLIERVWLFFKKNVLYNKYYENLAEFRKASIKFFQNIDDYTDELFSLLSGGFEGHNYT